MGGHLFYRRDEMVELTTYGYGSVTKTALRRISRNMAAWASTTSPAESSRERVESIARKIAIVGRMSGHRSSRIASTMGALASDLLSCANRYSEAIEKERSNAPKCISVAVWWERELSSICSMFGHENVAIGVNPSLPLRPGLAHPLVSVLTPPVTLHRLGCAYHMGPYEVSIKCNVFDGLGDYNSRVAIRSPRISAMPRAPHYSHPHCRSNGSVCWGQYEGPLASCLARGSVSGVMSLAMSLVSKYHDEDLYRAFDCWNHSIESECPGCRAMIAQAAPGTSIYTIYGRNVAERAHTKCVAMCMVQGENRVALASDVVVHRGVARHKSEITMIDGEPYADGEYLVFGGRPVPRTRLARCSVTFAAGPRVASVADAWHPNCVVDTNGRLVAAGVLGHPLADSFLAGSVPVVAEERSVTSGS